MNDPRRPQRFGPPLSGYGPTGPQVPPNPPTADPAYADQSPYASTYGGYVSPPWSPGGPPPRPPQWPPGPHEASPTQQLPQYWQYDQPPPGGFPPDGLTPPPPQGPRTPRWLWFAAGSAVLLVVALVIALVIANGSVKKQTAIEPLPPMPGPSPTRPTTTTPTPPSPSAAPAPTTTTGTPSETVAGAMQTVVYDVTGEAGQSASRTWIAATSYRPSSTSPCRGGKRSACQSRPCIPLASRSSTSATTSPARSPWPGFRYASAPGRG